MTNVVQYSMALVGVQDLEDGVPIKCRFTLEAFLYLKANGIHLNIMEPENPNDAGDAPFFRCGADVYMEHLRDLNETIPLIGLSSYCKFDERRFSTKSDVKTYTKQFFEFFLLLRRFVFSTYTKNKSDVIRSNNYQLFWDNGLPSWKCKVILIFALFVSSSFNLFGFDLEVIPIPLLLFNKGYNLCE